uniref:Uncharacterized protein n=1 Tax=Anguilla anguilla TaxID=7936 RepID=A0A0E9RUK8_ANGAN
MYEPTPLPITAWKGLYCTIIKRSLFFSSTLWQVAGTAAS